MRTIILAAGKSSRFAKEGWTIPKHLLPMPDGRKLIEWQEERMFRISDDVWTVLTPDTVALTLGYIKGDFMVVKDSLGVLNTVLQSIRLCFTKLPVLITYCDSFLRHDEYKIIKEMSPWLDAVNVVFPSDNRRFNYPVPHFADGGIFKFSSGWKIIKAMLKYRPPYTDKDGLYLLVKNTQSRAYYTSSTHQDVGTPEEYKAFMTKHGKVVEI